MTEALCKYYGSCGGCSLQHLPAKEYTQHKRSILLKLVARLGYPEAIVSNLIEVGTKARRRVEFKTSSNKGNISLGFCEAKSHKVVNIDDCPVTQSNITALIPQLRQLVASLKKPSNITGVNITAADNGFDIYLVTRLNPKPEDKQKLLDYCQNQPNILRFSVMAEQEVPQVIHNNADVNISFDGVNVKLPTQAFLQATQKGQDAITNLIKANITNHNKVADLYCGCGTYALPLTKIGCKVTGYEGNPDMIMAAHNAAKQHGLQDNASFAARDLVTNPLSTAELANFDAVIINPPRSGALPQVKQIAASGVNKVIVVSCNPTTFERDAKCLLQAGYKLTNASPIDQFYQTNHLELVAVFDRV